MKNKSNRPLTDRERDVLLEIARLNGPQWKTLVAEAWETRLYFNLKGVTLKNCQYLHRFGVEMGASWLKNLNIEDLNKAAQEYERNGAKRLKQRFTPRTGQKRIILRTAVAEMSLVLRELLRLEELRSQGQDKDLENYQEQWNSMLKKAQEVVSWFPE